MHIKPKKKLGQNFLFDKNIQAKIISACNFSDADTVLEIGPGTGAFTALIAERVKKLIAVEFDKNLAAQLKDELARHGNLILIEGDILGFDFRNYFSKTQAKIKVFGNIPYYITTPIIEYLLENADKISEIYLTVQKEFARRATAREGGKEYGSLSCFVQYYSRTQILFDIKRTSFRPAPKVDSSFIKIMPLKRAGLSREEEDLLFKIIRNAFQQRRKIFVNSIERIVNPELTKEFFTVKNISQKSRPEDISLDTYLDFAKFLKNN